MCESGSWFMDHGSWIMVHGERVHGSWIMVHGRVLNSGSLYLFKNHFHPKKKKNNKYEVVYEPISIQGITTK